MHEPRRELVLATANPHKVEEMRAILAPATRTLGIQIRGLGDLVDEGRGPLDEPEESGQTFEHNAAIKALAYARQTGRLCLADDSGLEIDALGGRPGVISSHYFNDGRTDGAASGMLRGERDELNNARVMRELAGVAFERRTARFVCVMAVATPGSLLGTFRGVFEGRIGFLAGESADAGLIVPRGRHGFGYDPLFLVGPEFARTGAELDPEVKNRLSHRAGAAGRLLDWLAVGGLGGRGFL